MIQIGALNPARVNLCPNQAVLCLNLVDLLVAPLPVLYRNRQSAENVVGSVAGNLRGSRLINIAKVNHDSSGG